MYTVIMEINITLALLGKEYEVAIERLSGTTMSAALTTQWFRHGKRRHPKSWGFENSPPPPPNLSRLLAKAEVA